MKPKEQVQRILNHEPVDRVPTQINYTTKMVRKLADHLGVALEELPKRFGNHLLRLDVTYKKRTSEDGTVAYDWWGAGWDTREEGYRLAEAPLAETESLEGFPWPDPEDPRLLDAARAALEKDAGEHFAIPNFGFALFERAWSLRGFETFLMDPLLNPEYTEELLERITEIQVTLARRYVALGVDGGYFGDDLGAQRGTLLSPGLWRKTFKPRLARMFAVFRDAGLPVIMHSDGDIVEILPDLIEIGLSALNPCQPEVLDHKRIKREYGKDLAFYGGVSTQEVLPRGTPGEVRAAVESCVRTLGSDGTGLLLGPSHRMMSDIPMSNVDALLEAIHVVRFA
jgi:uroporphyrinogen decarboxylase